MKPKILIANPSGDGLVCNLAAQLRLYTSREYDALHCEAASSIVTYAFNQLWATALNARSTHGVTHFLLWHADIRPKSDQWLATMLQTMTDNDADVLAAIVPIKDKRGLTSTGFDMGNWKTIRLTQTEIWSEAYPETWTSDNLLFNTGLMLVDFRKDWVEKVCFTINDRIAKNDQGLWAAHVESEDWNFSKQCSVLGVKAFVTRTIPLEHRGVSSFHSDEIWGHPYDIDCGLKEAGKVVTEEV